MKHLRHLSALWLVALLADAGGRALSADLSITSVPPGATAFLDDRYIGLTPVALAVDGAGSHLVRLEKRGYAPWRGSVEVGDQPAKVEAQLTAEALGRISVMTNPPAADVYVDGLLLGKSPIAATDLELSSHTVQAVRPGYALAEQEVTLTAQTPGAEIALTLSARLDGYLLARIQAHPDDVVAMTDLAHEYAIRHQFEECLAMLGKAFDAVADNAIALDQDDIRRVYQEVERLHDKQFDYAADDVVAALRPRLLQALRAGIARRPANGETYETLGDLLAADGDPAGALTTYEGGAQKANLVPVRIRLLGAAGSARYAKGAALEQAGKWPEAVAAYEELVAAYPQLWCSENALVRICSIQGTQLSQPDKAYGAARLLVERFPNSPSCPQVLAQSATCLAQAKQDALAAEIGEAIATDYPWSLYAVSALTRSATYYEQTLKDSARAQAAWQKVIEIAGAGDSGAGARHHLADLRRAGGDAAGADALMAEIARDLPLSATALRVETDPSRKQHMTAASTAYQEAAKLQNEGKPGEAVARCDALPDEARDNYYACAAAELAIQITANTLKDPAKAVERHLAFVSRWPSHPESPQHLYQAGYLLEATIDDTPRAVQTYQQCVDSYPQSYYAAQCLYRVGYVLMYKAGYIDYAKSMAAFLKLAQMYPHSDYARLARKYAGDCQMQLRDTQKARAMFLELMNEDPNDYAAYLAAASGYQWVRMRKDPQQ